MFSRAESDSCRRLVEIALAEDLGSAGDITSKAIIPADLLGKAAFVARQPGVLSGMQSAEMVCRAINSSLEFKDARNDGEAVGKGKVIARVRGSMRSILAAERTALNFLQYLSGIATLTRQYVDAVAGAAPAG